MTLFEQPPVRPVRPEEGAVFASLARARRRRRAWVTIIVVSAVLLVGGWFLIGTGADRAVIAQVGTWAGSKALPSDIATVADRAFLTEESRRVLSLVGASSARGDDLQRSCGAAGAGGDHAVAGCYSRAGIFVFVPADARVADVAVTILAHELLHAAFERLGAVEGVQVRSLLHAAMDRVGADDPVRQQIDWSVADHEETRDTELFAYLGSQVWPDGGFDPELEAVYARYFTDRHALVEVDHRLTAAVETLIRDYETASAELARVETDAAIERVRLDADRDAYEIDRQMYQRDADDYNARDPRERGRVSVQSWDSSGRMFSGTWQEVLAARLADLDTRHADLEARTAALDAADADVRGRRAAIEAQYADVLAVTRALDPAAPGS